MSKLFKDAILCLGPPYRFVEGHIIEEEGIIVDVLEKSMLPSSFHLSHFDQIIDCSNCVITPGFINGHIHLNQLLNRACLDGKNTEELLEDMHEKHFKKTKDDRYWASLLSIYEGLLSGTTFFSAFATGADGIADAMALAGIRGSFTIAKKDTWLGNKHKVKIFETDQIIEKMKQDIDHWKFPIITPQLGVASDRAASPELLKEIGKLAKIFNTRVALHVSEGQTHVNESIKYRGMPPVEFLSSFELFNSDLILIHATVLTDKEIELISKKHVSVCHCPISNTKTGAGLMDLKKMKSHGINIFMGTDAASTGNTNNILLEAYCAILLHNSFNSDASFLNAEEVFKMITVNAAKAIGLENKLGCLAKGYYADFCLWEKDQPLMQPFSKDAILNLLIYSGAQLSPRYIFVNGKCICDNFPLNFDLKDSITHIQEYSQRVTGHTSHG